MEAPNKTQTVFVVDDDYAIRRAMELLLQSVNISVQSYETADDFLQSVALQQPGCLVLDIRMPGMSGLELQELLRQKNCSLPIIFISGHGDIPMAVDAMRNGALDFIEKPFSDDELLQRIATAFNADLQSRQQQKELETIQSRIAKLTQREREVFDLIVDGKANKVIAHTLSLSQRTVEIHRSRVMRKMAASSLADLVRMHIGAATLATDPSNATH